MKTECVLCISVLVGRSVGRSGDFVGYGNSLLMIHIELIIIPLNFFFLIKFKSVHLHKYTNCIHICRYVCFKKCVSINNNYARHTVLYCIICIYSQ